MKDPVGPHEGPRLVLGPLGVSSCVPRVPGYVFNPIKGKVSDSELKGGGGLTTLLRPHIAKSYFETYEIYNHMQKIH